MYAHLILQLKLLVMTLSVIIYFPVCSWNSGNDPYDSRLLDSVKVVSCTYSWKGNAPVRSIDIWFHRKDVYSHNDIALRYVDEKIVPAGLAGRCGNAKSFPSSETIIRTQNLTIA